MEFLFLFIWVAERKIEIVCSMGAWIVFLPSFCTPCSLGVLLLYLSLLMFQIRFSGSCAYSHPDNVGGRVNNYLTKGQARAAVFWEVQLCEKSA